MHQVLKATTDAKKGTILRSTIKGIRSPPENYESSVKCPRFVTSCYSLYIYTLSLNDCLEVLFGLVKV
jgi:hypothetical protein